MFVFYTVFELKINKKENGELIMKIKSIIAVSAVCILATSASAFATTAKFTTTTKNTTKVNVKSVQYDYSGSDDDIEINFLSNIKLNSTAKATVKDSSGKSYTTYIEDRDSDEIELNVSNLKSNETYTITITGIKESTASTYGTVTTKFTIPKASTNLVKDVDYDAEDCEVDFEFSNHVTYENAKVVITDANNTKTYTTNITDYDNDELTVQVNGLTKDSTYKYTITGVTNKSDGTSKTLSGTFTAIDND